jgi:hypothetical protein
MASCLIFLKKRPLGFINIGFRLEHLKTQTEKSQRLEIMNASLALVPSFPFLDLVSFISFLLSSKETHFVILVVVAENMRGSAMYELVK